ncbi:BON domain-containing protein [Streptomyces canus]|uniref:BON domain-containing protein n=1 Tax=Streptomyces canus TaxID=58343 RepID=UPI0036E61572
MRRWTAITTRPAVTGSSTRARAGAPCENEDIVGEVHDQVVALLFPDPVEPIRVTVRDGVVALTGRVRDTSIVPVAARLVRAVEGVVDVDCALLGPTRRPDLDPDLPDATPAAGADRDPPVPSDGHPS